MSKTTKPRKSRKKYPERAKDVPVTQAMLFDVRDQLDAKFVQVNAKFEQVDAKFEQVDARFDQMDARFDQMDARFDQMDGKVEQKFHEIKLLVEEQNARNRIVLDGLTNLFARQERIENKLG